jgi:hypothetical protein
MIHYSLSCERQHPFESWFRDSAAFDAQVAGRLVACPVCGSTDVVKALMAPAVARRKRGGGGQPPEAEAAAPSPSAAAEAPAPVALVSNKERELRAALKAMRAFVEANSDDVGRRFAEEARRMHAGEIDHRAIRGEATGEEARALLDEGIEVHPLPILPDERN